jgi:capsular exopolysaccharide synthesis family protein
MSNHHLTPRKDNNFELDPFMMPEMELYSPDNYYGDSSPANEKQQIYRIISNLRKYWVIIVSLPLLVTALVLVYEAQKPEYYKAGVRIQVNNEINPAGSSVILAQTGDPAYFTTQLQILEGSGLLRRVIKTMDLEHNEAFLKPLKGKNYTVWQNVLRMFGLYKPPESNSEIAEAKPQNKLSLKKELVSDYDKEAEQLEPYVGKIKGNLEVYPVKDFRTASKETRLIGVEYTHNDPIMATKIVNAIADTYVLQNLEQKVETNADAGDFLQKRVAELQSQIRLGEERLINYAKSNQILSLDSTQNTVVQRLSALNGQLGQAENERISAEAAYRAALQNPMINQVAEKADPRTAGLQAQLTTLRQQLDQLKTEYTEEWYQVKNTRRQIELLENELQKTAKTAAATQIANLEQPYRAALSRERELRKIFDQQRSEVLAQNEAAINYRIIQQEVDTNKKLLEDLLQRSRETEVVLNGTPNNVHIVDRALVPRSPAGPDRAKNVILAFLSSLTFAVGLSFMLGWLNDTIRHTDDLHAQLGLPLIGLIPAASRGFAQKFLPERFGLKKRLNKNLYDLEKFEKPLIAEAYHQLRTSLLLSTPGGPAKTILITSGQPGEGKTVTSINLAKSLSELGGKVLLIDADLRYPRLHLIKEISNQAGLTSLLTMKEIDQETLDHTLKMDANGKLFMLTAGPNTPNPANLLSSDEMRNLVARLEGEFSHIVIDSPPVLYFADSVILSNYVKAVMLIARDNFTSRQIILQAKKMLYDVRAKVIGVVLNDIPLSNYKYTSYEYYRRLEAPSNGNGEGIFHIG